MKKIKKGSITIFLLFMIFLFGGCNHKMNLKGNVITTFISCGSSDAILIEYQNHYAFIDTGEDICRDKVISYLDEKNINKIDFIILTHPDKDHIGNAVAIMKNKQVDFVYMTDYQKNSSIEKELFEYLKTENIDNEIIKKNKKIKIEELEFLIEPPLEKFDSSNNSSLLVTMKAGDVQFFFGADIKKKRIETLLNNKISQVQIVKMPYHGRYISNMKQLLTKLDPEFVIITSEVHDEKTDSLLDSLNIDYTYITENVMIITDGRVWERK